MAINRHDSVEATFVAVAPDPRMTIDAASSEPSLAAEFRRRRERLGFSVRQLALAMDISPGFVSMMQNGRRPIRRVYWLALSQLELLAVLHDTQQLRDIEAP